MKPHSDAAGRDHMRLSRLLSQRVMDGPHETPEFIDAGVPFLSVDNVIDGHLSFDPCRFVSPEAHEEYSKKCRPRRGDVILTKAASVGKVALVEGDEPFNVWSPLAVIRPDVTRIDSRFLYYCLVSQFMQDQLQLAATSNTQQNIAMGDIAALRVPLVDLPIQRRIADYLDRETARIDALIAAKRRLIELLDLRASLALEAEVGSSSRIRLKFLTSKIGSGKTPSGGSETYADSGVLLIRSQNVLNGSLDLEDVAFIDAETDSEMANSRVKAGDCLLNITGASMGRCAWAPSDLPESNVNQHVCIIRPREIPGELIHFLVRLPGAQEQIRLTQVGSNRDGLNYEQVGNLIVPRIPASEATETLSRLRLIEDHRQKLSQLLERQIRLASERRHRLITAAVTGELAIAAASI